MRYLKFGVLWVCLAVCQGLYALAPTTSAANVGVVIFTSGEVDTITSEGKTHPLKRGSVFHAHETIITHQNAKAKLRFSDGNIVSLSPESRLQINAYAYNPKVAKENTYAVKLLKGGMLTVSGAIVKLNPKAYKIETDVGSIGIWSTTVLTELSVNPQDGSQQLITTNIESGPQGVTTTLLDGKTITIEPQHTISVASSAGCIGGADASACAQKTVIEALSAEALLQKINKAGVEPIVVADKTETPSGNVSTPAVQDTADAAQSDTSEAASDAASDAASEDAVIIIEEAANFDAVASGDTLITDDEQSAEVCSP